MKRPTVEQLLAAYSNGVFPMAHEEAEWDVFWYEPDPRAILPFETFHVSKSLARTVRQKKFEIRLDHDFAGVMKMCAEIPRTHESGTWISDGLLEAYTEFHHLGFAHSVEAYLDDKLVGGLYGVSIKGLFAGESMFHTETDASKVCLVHLVNHLQTQGFVLHDTQFMTDHLRTFGAIEVSREEYQTLLDDAMRVNASF